ncbi:hypothetical protein E2320_017796 [Naja naja]|nr:hypothetical protein E2320_017796 [Naja naja]
MLGIYAEPPFGLHSWMEIRGKLYVRNPRTIFAKQYYCVPTILVDHTNIPTDVGFTPFYKNYTKTKYKNVCENYVYLKINIKYQLRINIDVLDPIKPMETIRNRKKPEMIQTYYNVYYLSFFGSLPEKTVLATSSLVAFNDAARTALQVWHLGKTPKKMGKGGKITEDTEDNVRNIYSQVPLEQKKESYLKFSNIMIKSETMQDQKDILQG